MDRRSDRDFDSYREPSRDERRYSGEDTREMDSRRDYRDDYEINSRRGDSRSSRMSYGQVEGDYRDDSRRDFRNFDEDFSSREGRYSSRDSQDYQGDTDRERGRGYNMRDERSWRDEDDAYQEALRSGSRQDRMEEDEDLPRRGGRRGGRSSHSARH